MIQSTDYAAIGYPGTLVNCTVSGTLQATIAGSPDIYVLTDEFSSVDMYAATYLSMQWVSPVFVPRYNGSIMVVAQFSGAALVEYQFDGGTGNDGYAPADDYSMGDLYGATGTWSTWPGSLDVKRGQGIIFRVSIPGGSTQGVVGAFAAYFSMPLVRQTWPASAISAGGSRLSPPAGNPSYAKWVQVNTAQITPLADGSGAVSCQVLDLHPVLGPSIQLLNSTGISVTGTATVDIGGFVDV